MRRSMPLSFVVVCILFLSFSTTHAAIGSVSGTVTDAGGPVEGVWVQAFDAACGGNWLGGASTNASGDYTIADLPTGNVYLQVCPTCSGQSYVDHWYDGTTDCNSAAAVSVSDGGDTPDIDFFLQPAGSISGRVVDKDGDPISGLQVEVRDGPWGTWVAGAQTQMDGSYQILGVPVGDVYVRACADCKGMPYLNTWYGAPDWADDPGLSTPVAVSQGAFIQDIDFSLRNEPRIVQWFDVAVYNGQLDVGFSLIPAIRDLLESAAVSFPNPARGDYAYDLTADRLLWDSECRFIDMWTQSVGAVEEPADYGIYTFTLVFKGGHQLTFDVPLEQSTVVGANDDASLTVNVADNGDLTVNWTASGTPEPDQKWQVRVKEGTSGPGKEVFRSSSQPSGTTSMTIPVSNLGCVALGGEYRVRVRALSADEKRLETVEKAFTYNPANLSNRWAWREVTNAEGSLAIAFNVRPASRANVVSASVSWPGGGYTYDFDLESDWYDLSTETRNNKGWWVEDPAFPMTDGDYTFTIAYADGHTDTVLYSFTNGSATPVDPSSMAAHVAPNGSVNFTWELPQGVINQQYQVRIVNNDYSREFYSSGTDTDQNQMHASVWDLRGLVPGRTYQWRVRAWDENHFVREQSTGWFFYDPFGIGGPDMLSYFQAWVNDGELRLDFGLQPAYREMLAEAYVQIPNAARGEYPRVQIDLAADRFIWDSVCRPVDIWTHDMGPVQAGDYGRYELILVFENGWVKSYEADLVQEPVVGVDSISSVTVNADGSVRVDWTATSPDPNQTFQIRIKELGTGQEFYKSPNRPSADRSYVIPAQDLGCLKIGETYNWRIRSWSDRSMNSVDVDIASPVAYDPSGANRIEDLYVADHNNQLMLEFDVAPADRENVLSARIDGPDGFSYVYDLAADWYDMSTETRRGINGWNAYSRDWPIADGAYTLTVEYDRNKDGAVDETDTLQKDLTVSTVFAVDAATMNQRVNPDGSINFWWQLPGGASSQYYQVRIRNVDQSLEFFRSASEENGQYVYAGLNQIGTLVPGQTYVWLVRAFDSDYNTMRQSQTVPFVYSPVQADRDDPASGTFLYDDFSGPLLDPNRWVHLEIVRQPQDGVLVSAIRTGSNWDRNHTQLPAGTIPTSFKSDVRIVDIGRETEDNTVFARVGGSYYNAVPGAVDDIGNVFAGVMIGDRGSGLEAWWGISEKTAQPNDWNVIAGGTLAGPGVLSLDTVYKLEVVYDGATGFTFNLSDASDQPIQTANGSGPAYQGPAVGEVIALTTGAGQTGDSPGLVSIAAEFDNVMVDGALHDNFDGQTQLDPSKWNSQDVVRRITDWGTLALLAHSEGGQRRDATMIFPQLPDNIQADFTVHQDGWISPGARGRARISGYYYNDTYDAGNYVGLIGNVWAQIMIDRYDNNHLEAKAYAERVDDEDQTSTTQLLSHSFTIPIFYDRPYQLSIQKTWNALIFRVRDPATGAQEQVQMPISGNQFPAADPYRGIRSRVYGNGTDSSGRMLVEVDNVFVEQPPFQPTGVVYNRHNADGSFATHLEVDPGQNFLAPLPEGIETLRIEGPNGLLVTKADMTYDPQFRTFYTLLPGSPDLGEYTFTLTSGTQVQRSKDLQLFNRPLPIPNLIGPAAGELITSRTPGFFWQEVDYPGTRLYYRLEIWDGALQNRVYASGRMQNVTEASVPDWALAPESSYQWRVRVVDSSDWTGIQNRSQSAWRSFTTAATLDHASAPAFDPANWYAATYTTAEGTMIILDATVTDADGVAVDGSSHEVKVTFPDNSVQIMDFYGTRGTTSGEWILTMPVDPQPGDYLFEVTDIGGNNATLTDNLTDSPLAVTPETSIVPNNRSESITATFDNVMVNGSLYDNFDVYGSAADLDPAKWGGWGPDTGVAVAGQKLELSAGGTVGRGDATVNFADPANIHSIAADVTITDASSDSLPRARIYGYFFSNGQADVAAQILVRKNGVYYSVNEEYYDDVLYWVDLDQGALRTDVTTGDTVTLSISFDGSSITFDAGDGNTHTYTPTGPIYPPEHQEKQLKARTNFVVPVQPTFRWDPVAGADRYRFRIYDTYNNRTIHRGYADNGATSYTVPAGVLEYDHMYRYRIQAWDSVNPGDVDNASRTPAHSGLNFVFYTQSFAGQDSDGDGVLDDQDAFPFDPTETTDTDNDGVGDNADVFPNDPNEWLDTDGDGTGNNADTDDDNDGMPDSYELAHGLNPLVDDADLDRDGDGVSNIDEMNAGTDPSVPDTVPTAAPGDVNGDNSVDLKDAVLAFQLAAGLNTDSEKLHLEADVNGDGSIGVPDAVYILQYVAGKRASDVSTVRDGKGIWYVVGPADAEVSTIFEAVGYAEATDRLWQSETYRRAARGTLAAIMGPSALNQDILARITGYTDQELTDGYNSLGSEAKAMIDGYVAGFNRRIAEVNADPSKMPYEFKALGFTSVDPWTPEDVLVWTSVMLRNFDPEATAQAQLDNAQLLNELVAVYGQANGFAMFNDLRWGNDPDALTYISGGASQTSTGYSPLSAPELQVPDLQPSSVGIAADRLRLMRQSAEDSLKKINAEIKMGSYAWVLDGNKTASGNPIIYSGPQMGFSTPAITMEGAIFAGGLDISGMTVVGIPGIIIGRTPHHAWSMQVGHAHTVDYYIETQASVGTVPDRFETIEVLGQDAVTIPVWKTAHGPILNPIPYDPQNYNQAEDGPIVAWRYSHVDREFATLKAFLDLARAQSMDEFGTAIADVAVSQHFCYADTAGNIAHWMSGYDPNRPTGEYRLPQGAIPGYPIAEWEQGRRPLATVRNPAKGYLGGWNNKASADYPSSYNNLGYFFGPFHRAHVLDDYLSSHSGLTLDQIRNIALYIASTDSFGGGGNPWPFVENEFSEAVTGAPDAVSHPERQSALNLLTGWDGHFVAGGPASWAFGQDRASAWMLMDKWIREVLRLTFEDELGTDAYERQRDTVLFNVLLHGLPNGTSLTNTYDWFANNLDAGAPQTADAIVVAALDNVLAELGMAPWGTGERGEIVFAHDILGVVHRMPFSSRSTFAHCVEYGGTGPLRIESMFALGQSGDIRMDAQMQPVFDPNFNSMTGVFDGFAHRPFPLNP